MALVALAACSGSQGFSAAHARAVSQRAADSVAVLDPQRSKHIKGLIDLAERVTERDQQAPFWQRDEALVTDSWGRVLEASFVALSELRLQRSEARARWLVLEKQLEDRVQKAREQALAPGLSGREVMFAKQAEVTLDQARRLVKRGEINRALRLVETISRQTDDVEQSWRSLHARFADRSSLRRWQSLVDASISQSQSQSINVFVVDKLNRRLYVYVDGRRVDSFPIELGARGLRQKLHSGDKATPEGRYRITEVRQRGQTRFYKALMLDYPNSEDRVRYAEARRRGQIPRGAGIGALIEIHGDGGRGKDWTDGCIALSNAAMDRLFRYASVNTPVVIVGTVAAAKESR